MIGWSSARTSVVGIGGTAPTEGHGDADRGSVVCRVYDEVVIQRMDPFVEHYRPATRLPQLSEAQPPREREAAAVDRYLDLHFPAGRLHGDADRRGVPVLGRAHDRLVNQSKSLLAEIGADERFNVRDVVDD